MEFVNVQPKEGNVPRLVNVAHVVQLVGETLKLTDGSTLVLHAESVLRLHRLWGDDSADA